MSKIQIINASNSLKYLDALYELDKDIFNTFWANNQWENELKNESVITFLAVKENKNIGFASAGICANEIEIRKIGILENYRRQKVASFILRKILDMAKAHGILKVFLEVNENNKSAILFYKNKGFITYNIRRGYYEKNENAVCMQKII
ncbi:MAG: GNAT family N-acetyltransferase [Spirochaetia bacterium]|nr:GNAT family N-acetyltransferase [Spirochaetia bacterium]